MDSDVEIIGLGSGMGMGKKPSSVLRAHVVGIGVFLLDWKEPMRIALPAGDHVVAIWARLARKKEQGLSHAQIQVASGQVIGVTWRMPATLFGHGTITPHQPAPTARRAGQDGMAPPSSNGPCALTIGGPGGVTAPPMAAPPGGPRVAGPGAPPPPPPPPPAPAPPLPPTRSLASPRWQPDPAGRWPWRWWDGAQWSPAVSDGTNQAVDPVAGN